MSLSLHFIHFFLFDDELVVADKIYFVLGAVGDTIVGRVTQVAGERWKLDVNSMLDAELRLVNVHLPGGEQVGYFCITLKL